MKEGGERPAGRGAEVEGNSGCGATTLPAHSMLGTNGNKSGHCRKSNKAQNDTSGALVPAVGLSNCFPAAESSFKTGDRSATSSALESTGKRIPAHITRTTILRSIAVT